MVNSSWLQKQLQSKLFYLSAMSFLGILWGLQYYFSPTQNVIQNSFEYILGAIIFGILGTIILNFYLNYKKITSKKIFIGLLAWVISFLIASVLNYPLLVLGRIILFLTRLVNIPDSFVSQMTNLGDLKIGDLWLQFFVVFLLIKYFYSKIFSRKYQTSNVKEFFLILAIPFIPALIANLIPSLLLETIICFGLIGLLIAKYFEYIFEKQKDEIIYP